MRKGYATKTRKRAARRMSELVYALHLEKVGKSAEHTLAVPQKPGTKAGKKGGRYGISKVVHEGVTFDSTHELREWLKLLDRQARGEIIDLQRQVPFQLAPAVDLGEKRKKKAMIYTADYAYTVVVPTLKYEVEGGYVVADAKGKMTSKLPDWRMRKHLMASVHGIVVQEV